MTDKTATNGNNGHKPWQWQPGQSGNPNGRPLASSPAIRGKRYFTDALLARLERYPEITNDIIDSLINQAVDGGRVGAIVAEMLWDRLEGPVTAEMARQAQATSNTVILMPSNGREASANNTTHNSLPAADDDTEATNDDN